FDEHPTRRRNSRLNDLERRYFAQCVGASKRMQMRMCMGVYVRRCSVAAAGVLALSVLGAANARAEEPPSKAPPSDSVAAQPLELARVRYKQGVDAFKES